MSPRRQKLLATVNWYLQSSLKHITELIIGRKSYNRSGRYRKVSLYISLAGPITCQHCDDKYSGVTAGPSSVTALFCL